jgi:CheY-like chemotaxis protein
MSGAGMLRFSIKDSGIGIKDEDKVKLFKPFEQLDLRKNRNVVGTGLGLAISYNLCRLMGGALTLESVYGEGSTFTVETPCVLADADAVEIADTAGEFTAPNARILVVDDIEINLSVAEALLSAFAISPDLVSSGAEAIEMVKKNRYDIIFMDHMMPEMDGLETTDNIRELGGQSGATPIVALTANAINGMEEMFLNNRMDGFLSKPLDFNSLNLCLRRWLPADLINEAGEA